ncbi:asparagine synthase (glutamine-hydrolyzing) [Citrifermentans bremense]|uniref:asparagine synthase (glutamine-hydrolyzing) n=1 Tax=Citrifermentans bremense TaxID=60035 RepID=UPI0004251A57|nr:asparagine synthase (glutamine-hydrolyzing) [Citrifermentans bremense]
MCGLAGICSSAANESMESAIKRAGDSIAHRGPDGEGRYLDPYCALAHRRLAVIDLGTGQQPIRNEDGNLVLVFNGEIYNYAEIRELLLKQGHGLKTASDSETIVHLFEDGEKALQMLRGMFAFAIWDRGSRELFAMRDRIGIKPFYYALTDDGTLVFGSEIKAILATGLVAATPDPVSVREYLTYKFTMGERTFFKGIRSLEPGNWLRWKDGKLSVGSYWRPCYDGQRETPGLYQEFEHTLEETIKYHLVSDVPVGAFLSGGLDTSSIVEVASRQLPGNLSTYTCGTPDEREGDLYYSDIVARMCSTWHHEILHTPQEFSSFMKKCIWHLDEPGGGSTAVHGYYVAKRARQDVKVLLSGEGADEVLGGYYHHWLSVYRGMSFFERGANYRKWSQWGGIASRAREEFLWPGKETALEVFMTRHVSPIFSGDGLYGTDFFAPARGYDRREPVQRLLQGYREIPLCSQVMYLDLKSYLYRILHIYDRMCMAVGLENRVPFLDHKFVEFCFKIPPRQLFRGMQTKSLLRRYLDQRLGNEIAYRPKTGFTLPVDAWFRQAIRSDIEQVLERFKKRGVLEPSFVDELWGRFLNAGGDREDIWRLVSLELWFQCFIDGETP